MRRYLEPYVAVVATLALAEILSRAGIVSAQEFPPVSVVASSLARDLGNPHLWNGIWGTISVWALGLVLVVVIALPAGVLVGASPRTYGSTVFAAEFLRTIPSVAALPLLIFVYGVGFRLNLMLIVLASVWPLLIQTMYGMQDVDPVLKATGRIYGLRGVRAFGLITLPSIAPYIATGLRLSATIALVISIAASLVVGGDGLGALIASAAESAQVPLMYGRVFLAGMLGLLLTLCLKALESRLLHWHASQREVLA